MKGTLIATHIYLLMGCAFPMTVSYIILRGGPFPEDWVCWSCSGVIFLGIGDTIAAMMGKMYGSSRWRDASKKTKEGSSFCVWAIISFYYFINVIIDPKINNYFLCFVMAAIAASVLEGCTLHYDNLVCSMFFMTSVVFFHAVMMIPPEM